MGALGKNYLYGLQPKVPSTRVPETKVRGRVGVTELKYVVLLLVYPIVRTMG